jgi:hypothetical protein
LCFSYGYLGISIDILFLFPGYFIALFIWMPGAFNRYFIAIKIARKWKKNTYI